MNHLSFSVTDLIHRGLGNVSMQGPCGFFVVSPNISRDTVCTGSDTHNTIYVISSEIMCE